MELKYIDRYWDAWITWRALGRRFLPQFGGFLDQPHLCMQVILTLDGLFETILSQNDGSLEEAEE